MESAGRSGSGKTALIEALVPHADLAIGHRPLVVTNDIFTREDARARARDSRGVLAPERVVGVETGSCPHTAVRDDPSMNLAAGRELHDRFPDANVVLVESGRRQPDADVQPALADYFIFVIDVAEGDKIPRKRGPGVTNSDLLVINKIDLAPYVRAEPRGDRARRAAVRGDRPFVLTNCFTGEGLDEVIERIDASSVSTGSHHSEPRAPHDLLLRQPRNEPSLVHALRRACRR